MMPAALYFLATVALLSLSAYVFLAYRGDSHILYSTWDARLLSLPRRAFLGLAAIAFFVCLFQGAKSMLGWMPGSWGSTGEDGEWQQLSTYLATMFAAGGLFLVQVIDRATHDRFTLRELAERIKALEKLFDASLDPGWLTSISNDFENRIAELEKQLREQYGGTNMLWHLHPEGQQIIQYRELIALTERHQKRLNQVLAMQRP